jgi:hypothetical protein
VDCNGIVNSKDAALILQLEADSLDLLPCEENGDVNGDSEIDSADAHLVLKIEARV